MPIFDYVCSACNSVWDEFHSISNRKTPESLPCPFCGKGAVQQSIVHTALPVSHVAENSHALKQLNRSKFAEKMQMIHNENPGSRMDKTSNIVQIK